MRDSLTHEKLAGVEVLARPAGRRGERMRGFAELVDVRLELMTGQTRSAHEPASAADGSGG